MLFVATFVNDLRSKFQVLSFHDSAFSPTKLNAKQVLCISCKKKIVNSTFNYQGKIHRVSRFCYRTSSQNSVWCGDTFAPKSRIYASTIF